MKAIYLSEKGGAESLISGEIPKPVPNAGEILVKVHATSLTTSELDWFPTFHTPSGEPRPFPIVLSHEFSGVIEELGPEVTGFSLGDEVHGLNDWFSNGAQAEYCVSPVTGLSRKPRSLDHVQAAVVPISALTAWQGLLERTVVQKGDRVLIHGAAGGVGAFAVQLAKWRGAHVIATASAGNLDFVRSLGADEVIDYRSTRFEEAAREIDVVFDTVGGETLARSWNVLKANGKVVSIATHSESATEQRVLDAFMLVRSDGPQLAEIAGLIDEGILRVFVEAEFPLARVQDAYTRAAERGARGKIVLRVAG